jgi:uncharacterized protein (TIGR02246 family)
MGMKGYAAMSLSPGFMSRQTDASPRDLGVCISAQRGLSFRVDCSKPYSHRSKPDRQAGEKAMKMTRRVLLFLLVLVLSSAGIAVATPQDSGQAKDRAAIEKSVQNYMDAWNTHDVHAVAMTYTDDCDFVNNFGSLTHGRSGMEQTFGPFMTGVYSATHQTGTVRSIRFLKPDVAAVDVDWEMIGAKNPDGSARPTRKGLHTLVMTKQSDGAWLIAIMHVHEFTATPQISPQPAQPPAK